MTTPSLTPARPPAIPHTGRPCVWHAIARVLPWLALCALLASLAPAQAQGPRWPAPAASAAAVAPVPPATLASALRMVKALGLGRNLGPMAFDRALRTAVFGRLAQRMGQERAEKLLRDEVAASAARHQDEWDHHLAAAWAPLLERRVFESMAREQKKSPYLARFMAQQETAGTAMRARAEPVLATVMAESLGNATDKAPYLR